MNDKTMLPDADDLSGTTDRRQRLAEEAEKEEQKLRERQAKAEAKAAKQEAEGEEWVAADELPPDPPPVKVKIVSKKKLWWDKRAEALKDSGTIPTNFHEQNVFHIDCTDDVKQNVAFFWDSEYMERTKPILPGADLSGYKAVTKADAEELGLKIPYGHWTEEGYCKVGHDAILKAMPQQILDEIRAKRETTNSLTSKMRSHEEEYRRQIRSLKGGHDDSGKMDLLISSEIDKVLGAHSESEEDSVGDQELGRSE